MAMKVLSLGAGVQSSTLLLMCLEGEFGDDYPRHAIFADTGWEPAEVYEWLDWLETTVEKKIEVHRVSSGNIKKDALRYQVRGLKSNGQRWASMPYFVKQGNREGMIRRQCTSEYKLAPLAKKQRELLGFRPRQRIPPESMEVWIGISWDEIQRMKPAGLKWQVNKFPLIDCRMSRADCKRWLTEHDYPIPPRSACIACPFKNDLEWRDLKLRNPQEWQEAVNFDKAIRHLGGMRGDVYVHRSCRDLDLVDLQTLEDKGQLNFFNQECEGMCGV